MVTYRTVVTKPGYFDTPYIRRCHCLLNPTNRTPGTLAATSNGFTSPAMDQSGLEPSSLGQVQSKKFLDQNRTNPQCFQTGTELGWTASDQSTPARIGPNVLGVTDTLSHQMDSYTYTHTCRLILPFTNRNAHLTPHPSPLATCHSPIVWYGWVSRGGAC